MARLKGQAFDTEEMYGQIGEKDLNRYALETGLIDGERSLDGPILMELVLGQESLNPRVLEVGCGCGRVGRVFLEKREIDYWGIDLHKPYLGRFRESVPEEDRKRILYGNFLTHTFPFNNLNAVLFPWSVMGDFNFEGQKTALKKSRSLLLEDGRIYVDVPTDIVNKVMHYKPGPFNIHEVHDLEKLGLKHIRNHPYETYTRRHREVIEIGRL